MQTLALALAQTRAPTPAIKVERLSLHTHGRLVHEHATPLTDELLLMVRDVVTGKYVNWGVELHPGPDTVKQEENANDSEARHGQPYHFV